MTKKSLYKERDNLNTKIIFADGWESIVDEGLVVAEGKRVDRVL